MAAALHGSNLNLKQMPTHSAIENRMILIWKWRDATFYRGICQSYFEAFSYGHCGGLR